MLQPWKQENDPNISLQEKLNHAFKQTKKDIETFFDIAKTLLKCNPQIIDVKCFVVFPTLSKFETCKHCSELIISKEELESQSRLAEKMNINKLENTPRGPNGRFIKKKN